MYVLDTEGNIKKYNYNSATKQSTMDPETPSNFLNEVIGDFKSGKNYGVNKHDVFDGTDNSSPLYGEILPDLNNLSTAVATSGIIGQSTQLYPYAFGNNMKAVPTQDALPFYKPYNSVFDLDLNLSGRDKEIEKNFELFADEAEMLYGVPMILNESDKFRDDLENVFSSLGDILAAAIVSITSISVIQGLLQVAQDGPPDPFGLFGKIKTTESDRKGRFINYVKLDPIALPFLAEIVNPLIEGFVSLLRTTERLMNFPSRPASPGLQGIFFDLAENIVSFCLGYIYYLIPGFKLEQGLFDTSPQAIITNLISTIVSLIFVNKSRHNYNLLIRKIVKNNYFRRNIQFKAKTITNADGSTYAYNDQFWYDLSGFFYRFIGERTAVGQKVITILKNTERNKKNKPFAVQKMKELPFEEKKGDSTLPLPVPIGSSILGKDTTAEAFKPNISHFNKSIYSLTSLIQNKSSNANSYLTYHEKLIKQNEAIYQNKEKRLSKEHVKELEAIINSDYMPFSIQDLRTNELFKFHAFVENYSDSFNVGWEDAGMGFGRMDSIKTYKGTSRNISVDFWLISMSPDDFDYMWWLVNRLVALIYPQWSAPKPANLENQLNSGILMSQVNGNTFKGIPFSQPFTQIPTGSPLIRLRLGDIFTSNYSKKGLARIFGFNLKEKNIENFKFLITDIKDIKIDNKNEYTDIKLEGYQIFSNSDYEDYKGGKTWGIFTNLDQQDFINVDNKQIIMTSSWKEKLGNISTLLQDKYSDFYYDTKDEIDLNDINSPPKSKEKRDKNVAEPAINIDYKKLIYVPINIVEEGEQKTMILLYSVVIKKDSDGKLRKFNEVIKNNIAEDIKGALIAGVLEKAEKGYQELIQNSLNLKSFLSADGQLQVQTDEVSAGVVDVTANVVNNPIVKSFESTMGEGLAGTIQGFTINFDQNIPWEINPGSRAPIAVKIGLQVSVIHDILPGLDHEGIMRAPTYRVGKLNNDFFGNSVYQDIPGNVGYSNADVVKKS